MRVAIASGKGGTGKTTVATNLAYVAACNDRSVAYLDCDVEEPNGHVFLRPAITRREAVYSAVPKVDPNLCNHCGDCGAICQYSAIVSLAKKVLVFPELCHSCGGCELVCAQHAISEVNREIGSLELGHSGSIDFVGGLLNIGEAMSPPVIRKVKASAPKGAEFVIVDAPPGTSCPVIESIRGCDLVVLVTEPTPFGLHDLGLAADMMKEIGIPYEVVVNRAGLNGSDVDAFCCERGIKIGARLPDDRRVAEAYSRGVLAAKALPEFMDQFQSLLEHIEAIV